MCVARNSRDLTSVELISAPHVCFIVEMKQNYFLKKYTRKTFLDAIRKIWEFRKIRLLVNTQLTVHTCWNGGSVCQYFFFGDLKFFSWVKSKEFKENQFDKDLWIWSTHLNVTKTDKTLIKNFLIQLVKNLLFHILNICVNSDSGFRGKNRISFY